MRGLFEGIYRERQFMWLLFERFFVKKGTGIKYFIENVICSTEVIMDTDQAISVDEKVERGAELTQQYIKESREEVKKIQTTPSFKEELEKEVKNDRELTKFEQTQRDELAMEKEITATNELQDSMKQEKYLQEEALKDRFENKIPDYEERLNFQRGTFNVEQASHLEQKEIQEKYFKKENLKPDFDDFA